MKEWCLEHPWMTLIIALSFSHTLRALFARRSAPTTPS